MRERFTDDVYDEHLFDTRAHYVRCRALARTAAVEHGFRYDLDHPSAADKAAMVAYGIDWLAATYGCAPEVIARLGAVGSDGLPRPGLIETPRGDRLASVPPGGLLTPEHHLHLEWWRGGAAGRLDADLRLLNKELRGVSRALWLTTLWEGGDVSRLRARWYSSSDVGHYWPAAWMCSESPEYAACLVQYGRELVARYAALSPKGHLHAAHQVIEGAAALLAEREAA